MIKVTILKSNEDFKEFTISGHAGFASKGKDIVCAAVSALVINTVNSLEQLTDDQIIVNTDEDKGLIEIKFLSELSSNAKLLMESLLLGLNTIKDSGNKKYIHIRFEEV